MQFDTVRRDDRARVEGNEREDSDLFAVRASQATSIPPVEEIVLPPEEQRKQRNRRIAMAITACVTVALIALATRYILHAQAVEEAALQAGDTGRPSDRDVFFETLDNGEAPALRARVLAAQALAGELPITEAAAAIEALQDTGEAAERLKASAYLALAQGDIAQAQQAAGSIVRAQGPYGPETAYVQARVAYARGDGAGALASSEQAAQRESDRYRAMLVLALALAGRVDDALAIEGDGPALASAKARIHAQIDHADADEVIQGCIARTDLTRAESAWCQLAQARRQVEAGREREAIATLSALLDEAPPGDADFRWRVAELLQRADANEDVDRWIGELATDSPLPDAGIRARVLARKALAAGEHADALAALSAVPGTADAHLVAARIYLVSDQNEQARASALRAVENGLVAAGRALEAEILLAVGEGASAAAAARLSLEAAPTQLRFIEDNTWALLAGDATEEALQVTAATLEAHPGALRALRASGHAAFAAERWADALTHYTAVVAQTPDDAEIQGRRGDAARFHDDAATARTAYEAALTQEADQRRSLIGMLALTLDAGEVTDAMSFLGRYDEHDVRDSREVALLRVRALVDSGAGYAGVRPIERIKRRRDLRGGSSLRMASAELLLQAELYPRAVAMFDQARVLRHDRVEAFLGRAMGWAMDGRTNRANEAIHSALDAARPRDADENAPSPAADHPRLLVVRGRIEANLGRFPSAARYAQRALETDGQMAEAHMLLADAAARQRQDPEPHLRSAATVPRPVPRAWWQLARRLGANEEGCAFAGRFLRAAPRSEEAGDVRDFLERCE